MVVTINQSIISVKCFVSRLRAGGIPFRLISNESTATREKFCTKLQKHGFDVSISDILLPAPAMASILNRENLRPHLLLHPGLYY